MALCKKRVITPCFYGMSMPRWMQWPALLIVVTLTPTKQWPTMSIINTAQNSIDKSCIYAVFTWCVSVMAPARHNVKIPSSQWQIRGDETTCLSLPNAYIKILYVIQNIDKCTCN